MTNANTNVNNEEHTKTKGKQVQARVNDILASELITEPVVVTPAEFAAHPHADAMRSVARQQFEQELAFRYGIAKEPKVPKTPWQIAKIALGAVLAGGTIGLVVRGISRKMTVLPADAMKVLKEDKAEAVSALRALGEKRKAEAASASSASMN